MSTYVTALQAALTQEHAAVYGYGVVGAHLTGSERVAAADDRADHGRARDELEARVRAADAEPAAAAAAYALPVDVDGPATARELAGELEDGTAGAYAALVAEATGSARRSAIRALRDSAVRRAAWTGTTDPLPGLKVAEPSPSPSDQPSVSPS